LQSYNKKNEKPRKIIKNKNKNKKINLSLPYNTNK
jgi:hypothetical protein